MTVYLVVYQQMLDQMDITLSCNLHLSNSDSTRTCRIPCRVRVHCKHSGTPTPSAAPAVQEEAQAKLFLAYLRITNGFVLTTYINFTLHLYQLHSTPMSTSVYCAQAAAVETAWKQNKVVFFSVQQVFRIVRIRFIKDCLLLVLCVFPMHYM